MANEEHIKIAKRGSESIEQWYKENVGITLDLSNANLRRFDFTYANLNGANLKGANLQWADFRWADLIKSDLTETNLDRADFHKADLKLAALSKANLSNTNFEDANLTNANIEQATFSNTRLLNTDLRSVVGLYNTYHDAPSIIDIETYLKVAGDLPPEFIKENIFFNSPDGSNFSYGEPLYQLGFSRDIEQSKIERSRIWLPDIEQELLVYINNNPEKLREIPDRKFEEIIASIFKNQGFDVSLTSQTRDGGYDIFAVRHSQFTGKDTYLIECKRYAEQNKVGVGIVRSLLGVVMMNQATRGIIATTSSFTKPAKEAALQNSSHLLLHDYTAVRSLINSTIKI
ncbi:MAG: restriction endonuclease [Deltaproteobacteria bacterium]|nr:restriction endonuclease [Deltaproteobacteria bacterium]